jgi:hypothetical protein
MSAEPVVSALPARERDLPVPQFGEAAGTPLAEAHGVLIGVRRQALAAQEHRPRLTTDEVATADAEAAAGAPHRQPKPTRSAARTLRTSETNAPREPADKHAPGGVGGRRDDYTQTLRRRRHHHRSA